MITTRTSGSATELSARKMCCCGGYTVVVAHCDLTNDSSFFQYGFDASHFASSVQEESVINGRSVHTAVCGPEL